MFQIGEAELATTYDIELLRRDLKEIERRMAIRLGAMVVVGVVAVVEGLL